jgi:hypothetical protein
MCGHLADGEYGVYWHGVYGMGWTWGSYLVPSLSGKSSTVVLFPLHSKRLFEFSAACISSAFTWAHRGLSEGGL